MNFALGQRAISSGTRLEVFDRIESTNSDALARIRAGERGPLWLVTAHQTAGRGRRHRAWISPPGNLAASIIETVDVPPAVAATLGFAAALALDAALQRMSMETMIRHEGLRHDGGKAFALKWPNDVLFGGDKVAGILLETDRVQDGLSVVIGMGVNIVSAPQGTPYPATSLAAQGVAASAEDAFTVLSDSWAEFFSLWDSGHGFPKIRDLWLDRAAGLGEPVTIRNGETLLSGTFETIDDSGCLILQAADGQRLSIAAGDVHFGAMSSAGAV
ncbi:MAG: biotin--[acetyl-CoA-carboxylase] ligase [Xanthobacteraceae bacterium]|nr:biotin--[acetyl-CoA-carboxylase] ligase [Xanthobacteraceae bacterium]